MWGDFQPDWRGGNCVFVDTAGKWYAGLCDSLRPSLCEKQACPKGMVSFMTSSNGLHNYNQTVLDCSEVFFYKL